MPARLRVRNHQLSGSLQLNVLLRHRHDGPGHVSRHQILCHTLVAAAMPGRLLLPCGSDRPNHMPSRIVLHSRRVRAESVHILQFLSTGIVGPDPMSAGLHVCHPCNPGTVFKHVLLPC